MKFGHQLTELVDPKFRNYCISYNMLKGFIADTDSKRPLVLQTIQDVTLAAVPFLPPAHAEQLPSVRFQEALNGELDKINTFSELEQDTLLSDLTVLQRRMRSTKKREVLRADADRISNELCAFASFVDLNYTAFRKITKKESKVHKTSSSSWFMANVARAPFMTVDFDHMVSLLASCYSLLRSDRPTDPVVRTSSRVRSAWVSTKDLVQVKVALARAMQLVRPSVSMISQYYDTPWLDSYKAQLASNIESGYQVDQLVGSEVASSSVPKNFVPLVDCQYRRSLWRAPDAEIEIMLDEGATFNIHSGSKKRLDSSPALFEGHALYVTTSNSTELPDWLLDTILGLPGVTEIPQFTKRLHGIYLYAESTIGGVPRPSWVSKQPVLIQKQQLITSQSAPVAPATRQASPTIRGKTKQLANWILGNTQSMAGKRDTILKIEPKSFFACERNLLDWIHVSVILVGLAALHGGTVGCLAGLVPCILLLWETRVFRRRNSAMMEKDTIDYSDSVGPQILFVVLMLLTGDVLVGTLTT